MMKRSVFWRELVARAKKRTKAMGEKSARRKRAIAGRAVRRPLRVRKKVANKPGMARKAKKTFGKKKAAKKTIEARAEPARQKKELAEIYKKRTGMLTTVLGRQQLISLGGENAISVISSFSRDMSDEELAKKAEIKVSEVRAVLNRLHSVGLVEYVREKDASSGWYSYVWKMKGDCAEKFQVYCNSCGTAGPCEEFCGKELYYCRGCGARSLVVFEEALDRGFACGCGKKLEFLEETERGRVLGERKEPE